MINYSIIPTEVVFEDWDNLELQYKEFKTEDGITLLVESINDQDYRISKVISSNPQVYLRADLTPGTILKSSLNL